MTFTDPRSVHQPSPCPAVCIPGDSLPRRPGRQGVGQPARSPRPLAARGRPDQRPVLHSDHTPIVERVFTFRAPLPTSLQPPSTPPASRTTWALLGVGLGLSTGLIHTPGPSPASGQPPTTITLAAHEPPTTNPAAVTPCSTAERVGLGLEWSVPILATNASKACLLNATTPAGQHPS